MDVVEVTACSAEVIDALNALLPQLSDSAKRLTEDGLRKIIASDASRLLVAVEDGRYLGMVTVVTFTTPAGTRAWVEDVVVDRTARRKGVGRMLTAAAIEVAKASGAKSVNLTSRPSRTAANALYTAMGFARRETNVYKLDFTQRAG